MDRPWGCFGVKRYIKYGTGEAGIQIVVTEELLGHVQHQLSIGSK